MLGVVLLLCLAYCGLGIDQALKARGIFVAVWYTIWLSLVAGRFANIIHQNIHGIDTYQAEVKTNLDVLLSVTNLFDSCTDDITYVTSEEISKAADYHERDPMKDTLVMLRVVFASYSLEIVGYISVICLAIASNVSKKTPKELLCC